MDNVARYFVLSLILRCLAWIAVQCQSIPLFTSDLSLVHSRLEEDFLIQHLPILDPDPPLGHSRPRSTTSTFRFSRSTTFPFQTQIHHLSILELKSIFRYTTCPLQTPLQTHIHHLAILEEREGFLDPPFGHSRGKRRISRSATYQF